MNKRAFIFTMDAVLALIPIFVAMASVSQITAGGNLFLQGYGMDAGRIAHDTLETMSVQGDIEEPNVNIVNATLEKLIPDRYNYTYDLIFQGSSVLNLSKGNISEASNIVVARRLELVKFFRLEGYMPEVSHGGSEEVEELCPRQGNKPPIYEVSFFVDTDYTTMFSYWVNGEAPDKGVRAWYVVFTESKDCSDLRGGGVGWEDFMEAKDYFASEEITDEMTEGVTNFVYLRLAANPNVESYISVIRAPTGVDESLVTYDNAVKRDFAWAILKLWS
ncbi:MAG: hypothetical protein ACE5PM_06520 [Candidatus Hydrothermarchaeales archaeon]